MPIDRDRERAKRRYAKRQAGFEARAQDQRRRQQVIGSVVAVLVVIGGVLALTRTMDDPTTTPPRASASSSPTQSCPAPSARETAKQYAEVPPSALAQGKVWSATLRTCVGDIELELYGDKAPQTVSSFIFLARDKYFDDTPCHRLATEGIKVLQCGDPTGLGTGGPGYGFDVENVPPDGRYPAGTLAMARGAETTSNGSQFFLTYGDTTLPTDSGGYTVFGKVTSGLDVLQQVAAAGTVDGSGDGRPRQNVTINSITVEAR